MKRTNHYRIMTASSYHIVDLKRQNRLKVGTDKPKLKVKMRSVSDVMMSVTLCCNLIHRYNGTVESPAALLFGVTTNLYATYTS